MTAIRKNTRIKLQMLNRTINSKILGLIILVLLLHCQSKQNVWSKMSEKLIIAHTDTSPHFLPLHHEVYDLLETRIPHTVATNGLSDAITLFQLNEGEAKTMELTENLTGGISGGDISTTPLFSDEWIAYGQTRGFTRYNLRTHEFHDQMICTILDETVKACRALDPGKNIFVFMVDNMENNRDIRIFKTYDLSGEKPVKLASLETGKLWDSDRGQTVGVRDSILFYHNEKDNELVALNSILQLIKHPLAKAFYDQRGKILKLSQLVIHPTLPFAIVYGAIPWILSWNGDENDIQPFLYVNKNHYVTKFRLSHDGKHLAWMSESEDYASTERPQYWVAKVDDRIPGYIGKPQLLGSTYSETEEPLTTAWAENPNTFVVSEMNGLYWWHVE